MRFWFCHIQTAYESDLDIGVFYSLQASINSAIFHIIFSLLNGQRKQRIQIWLRQRPISMNKQELGYTIILNHP